MTNVQKLSLITGSDIDALNWTALVMNDGSQGPNAYNDATGFGEGSAPVYTWDKALIGSHFAAVAAEFYGKGIQVRFGVVQNENHQFLTRDRSLMHQPLKPSAGLLGLGVSSKDWAQILI